MSVLIEDPRFSSYDDIIAMAKRSIAESGGFCVALANYLYWPDYDLRHLDVRRCLDLCKVTIDVLNKIDDKAALETTEDIKRTLDGSDMEQILLELVLRDRPEWAEVQELDKDVTDDLYMLRVNIIYILGMLVTNERVPLPFREGGLHKLYPLLNDLNSTVRGNVLFLIRRIIEEKPEHWRYFDSSIVEILKMQTDEDDYVREEVAHISRLLF